MIFLCFALLYVCLPLLAVDFNCEPPFCRLFSFAKIKNVFLTTIVIKFQKAGPNAVSFAKIKNVFLTTIVIRFQKAGPSAVSFVFALFILIF